MSFADNLRNNYQSQSESSNDEWFRKREVKEIIYAVEAEALKVSHHATSLEGYLCSDYEGGYSIGNANPDVYLYKDANYLKYEEAIDNFNHATLHAAWSEDLKSKIFKDVESGLKTRGFKNIIIRAEDKATSLVTGVTSLFLVDIKKKFAGFSVYIKVSW
jgi:hypothetical protein